MIVMGIDPGIATTGWGVVEQLKDKNCVCHGVGVIVTPKEMGMPARLETLYDDICTLLTKYRPDVLAAEELFFNTNAKTALIVGQARGVMLLAGQKKRVPIVPYTPLQVKMAMTGYGRADKQQIARMVTTLLHLESPPKPDDAADALAIALTHCFRQR